jgi:hypothetical protein
MGGVKGHGYGHANGPRTGETAQLTVTAACRPLD